MSTITIDESRDPLIAVRFEGTASSAEFAAYLAHLGRLVEKRRAYVLIFDARFADRPSAEQRHDQSEWLKKHDALLREYSLGCVFVIGSALVRGALTAIFWLQPAAMPTTVVATLEEAEEWAAEKLKTRPLGPGH